MDFFDLKGKTALITGASSGLGKRFAQTLAQAGVKVILTARRRELLEDVAQEIREQGGKAISFDMDVSDKRSVEDVMRCLSSDERIDILINNAGIAELTPIFEERETHAFEDIINTNVIGMWYVTKAIACHMKCFSIEGSIINISSIYGSHKLEAFQTAYCASKAAVTQMTKALVGELSTYNIRINCIAPGHILTPMVSDWVKELYEANKIEEIIPQKFLANPEDLDGALLYLASNKVSRYVTGSCLTIDGGTSWGGGK